MNRSVSYAVLVLALFCMTGATCSEKEELRKQLTKAQENLRHSRRRLAEAIQERREEKRRARARQNELRSAVEIEQRRRSWSDLYALGAGLAFATVLVFLWREVSRDVTGLRDQDEGGAP